MNNDHNKFEALSALDANLVGIQQSIQSLETVFHHLRPFMFEDYLQDNGQPLNLELIKGIRNSSSSIHELRRAVRTALNEAI